MILDNAKILIIKIKIVKIIGFQIVIKH